MDVLVSGALMGLGAVLCRKFLSEGHRVFAGVLQTEDLMELEELKGDPRLIPVLLDVSDKDSIEAARATVGEYTDRLDILINVAGVLLNREGTILTDRYEDLEKTFKVNTIGPVYICSRFFGLLAESGGGTVINISSEVVSIDGVGPKYAAYCMSKTAIAQYGFILKQTAAALGIPTRVFSVHPGRMKTAMGAENGQIEAAESAEGIYRLAVGEVLADNREIYVDYRGNAMLHQAGRKE